MEVDKSDGGVLSGLIAEDKLPGYEGDFVECDPGSNGEYFHSLELSQVKTLYGKQMAVFACLKMFDLDRVDPRFADFLASDGIWSPYAPSDFESDRDLEPLRFCPVEKILD